MEKKKRGRPTKEIEHGTERGYTRRCRCDACRAAHAAYMREWLAKNRARVNAERKQKYAGLTEEQREAKRAASRARNQRYYHGNLEHTRELGRKNAAAYRKRYPERHAKSNREWAAKNREKDRAWSKRWRENNAEYLRLWFKANKAKRKNAAGAATVDQVKARVAFFGHRCWVCKGPWTEIDHVKPISRGGSNWPANLRPACASCNNRKGSKPVKSLTWISDA